MRAFLNAILAFIASESLTDDEYSALPQGLMQDYALDTYNALKTVLTGREAVSSQFTKLADYYKAKGVDLGADSGSPAAASQIFIGSPL